jgi:prepilin-type processing-associated H-X9-DG protein
MVRALHGWELAVLGIMVVAMIVAIALMSQSGRTVNRPQTSTFTPPTTAPVVLAPPPTSPMSPATAPAPSSGAPSGAAPALAPTVTTPPAPPSPSTPAPAGVTPGRAPTDREPQDPAEQCLRNLKQIGLGLMMYCQDYDERMPPAAEWCTVVDPYLRNRDLFRCPSAPTPYGYAFNRNLDRVGLAQLRRPAATVLVFESSAARPNATDTGQSLCRPARHPQGNNFAYTDGHVRPTDAPQSFALTGP